MAESDPHPAPVTEKELAGETAGYIPISGKCNVSSRSTVGFGYQTVRPGTSET